MCVTATVFVFVFLYFSDACPGACGCYIFKGGFTQKQGFPGGTSGKEPTYAGDVRDLGLIPGLGRSSGGGHGNPLQNSCLKNAMDRSPSNYWTIAFIFHTNKVMLKILHAGLKHYMNQEL